MQVNVEVLSGLERKITVKATDNVDQEVEKRLKEMVPKIKLDGFRPGKVPMQLLRQRFGAQIREEVIGKIIDSTYHEAISQEKLVPAGAPEVKITHDKAGEPLEYQVTVEVYPVVKLQSLESVELENITVDITQKDVDEMIHKLRRQKAKWVKVDRPSKKGDRVIVSFEGRQNGELFEGSAAKEMPLELGSGTTIPGFEEGLTGHKAGDTIDLNLTFPSNYHVVSFASKPVHFTATIHKVEMPELPPLDEEFAKQLGVKEGGMEQLRISVLENMQRDVKQKVRGHLKGQLLDKILALHPVDLPKTLVDQELKRLQQQEQSYLTQMGVKQELPEAREELRTLARRRVQLGLVFGEFLDAHKLTADPERVNKMLEEIAAPYEHPEMVVEYYRENKKLYQQLEDKAVEDQLIDQLIAQTKQIDKAMKYSEFKGFKPAQED